MTSFPTRVAQASLKSDFSKMRKASAFRRGLVVFVVTLAAYLYAGAGLASHVAITAMFIGQIDRGGSPRQEWHWMAGATVLMTGVTLLSSALFGQDLLLLIVLAILAFWAGIGIGINIRIPAVMLYTSALFASELIKPVPPEDALITASAVFAAGALQTALTALTAPVVGDLPERRAVATALRELSEEFIGLSQDKASTARTISSVATSLTRAETFLRDSDISGDSRRRFADIISTADLLAREGRSYFSRGQANVGRPNDEATVTLLELVGQALFESSQALEVFKPEAHLARLDKVIAKLEQISETADSITATNMADFTGHLASSIKASMEDPNIHRGHRERTFTLWDRIKASLAWGSVPLKHGIRLACAVIIGMAAAEWIGLGHGSWVAVTMIMLLRPDAGPALIRFVQRLIGNIFGACIVVGVAFLAGNNNPPLIVAIGISSTLLFIVMPVNYAWAAMCSSATAIFALTIGGEDTLDLAVIRLNDVLLGCLLGVALAFMFPIWQRTNLPEQCSLYLKRVSKWIITCSKMAALDPDERDALMEKATMQASRVRAARQSLSATFDTSLVEPPTKQVDINAIGSIMRHMRQCNNSMVAAELLLAHGAARSKYASKEARRAARDVRQAAGLVLNPERRDTLTRTFDDLDLSTTGSLRVVSLDDLEAEQRRAKGERKERKAAKKRAKEDQAGRLSDKQMRKTKRGDLEVVIHKAARSAQHAYRAAESSKITQDTFM